MGNRKAPEMTRTETAASRAMIGGEKPSLDRWGGRLAAILLILAAVRFWIAPLSSSFWIDETGTFWTIKDGVSKLFEHIHEWPPSTTSAYGVVAWAAYAIGGAHEYVLRLPSVLAMALSAVLLYRLTDCLLDRSSALPAVAAFVSSETVLFAACDARPYALLLLAIVGSTLALVRWLDSGAPRYSVAYIISAALVVYSHYLGGLVLAVHAGYGVARLREKSSRRRLPQLVLAAASVAILVAPLGPTLYSMFQNRAEHVFADRQLCRSWQHC